jgi:hypothetical protein
MVDTRKGSPTRDAFKYWHKTQLPKEFYALDADLVLINKTPAPRIVAILDYKDKRESVQPTFSEVICYNHYLKCGLRVFIVQSDLNPSTDGLPTWLSVWEYKGGDYRPFPPVSRLDVVLDRVNPQRFQAWENAVRNGKA